MKITSQLALSQIKLNKKRTIGTISAIAFSAALITAVMCFVTSGNKMLVDFLGDGYGDYGGAYSMIIAVPALILGFLIAFMSVIVISNIFAASANKRIQEFGILKCVGGTRKQIKEIVIYESLWLSIIGIPLGLILGTIIGYIGVCITGHYVSDMNELAKSIIMMPLSFSLSFHVSVWTYIFATVFSFVIVIWSAGKPAKTVGKITAIQCIKGLGANKNLKSIDVKDGLVETVFGYEGAIGLKNIKRNRAGYKATIRALSLGIVLFLMTGGLAGQARDFKEWMNPDSQEMNVDYCSNYDVKTNNITGREEREITVPISAETYNEITDRLSEYGDIDIYGVGDDSFTYTAVIDKKEFSEEMLEVPDIFDDNNEMETTLIAVNDSLYRELCDRAGAEYGSNLLINSYNYNDNGKIKTIKPYNDNISGITLINAAEEKTKLEIGGILESDDLKEKGFYAVNPYPVNIVVPDIAARGFGWFCSPDDEQAYTEYARKVMDEYYPVLTENSYADQGYTVRISRIDTMVKVLNIAIVLAEIVMYGFVALLILMGFTSVISTLATNIRIRSREFAILRSVGMTSASLRKMIYGESIICVVRASISGIAFGIAIPFAINLSIRKMFPVLYHIPWLALVFGMIVLISMVMFITYIEIGKLKDKNIIDEIRMDVM